MDYLNKNCVDLKDFIISPEMNDHDLKKLCELNNIDLQISPGWHTILIELLIQLNVAGWDRKVSCIKEKYASLSFYTDRQYDEITDKFEEISRSTCETCGANGKQRYNTSWDYVACREHYLDKRGTIKSTELGFEVNGKSYLWNDVEEATFEDQYTKTNELLLLKFSSEVVEHQAWSKNELYIYKGALGYGKFLNNLPRHYKNLDYVYVDQYSIASTCLICGYRSVYNHVCECCENDDWKSKEENHWDKDTYLKLHKDWWIEDEGPEYSHLYNIYWK